MTYTAHECMTMVEPGLCHARERLRSDEPFEAIAATLLPHLAACRGFLEIHRDPVPEHIDPRVIVEEAVQELELEEAELEPVEWCRGDRQQIQFLLRALLAGAECDTGSYLSLILLEGEDRSVGSETIPVLAVAFEGPGQIPNPVPVGAGILIPLETLQERWTAATCGGRIDRDRLGWSFRFRGVRKPPSSVKNIESLLEAVREADRQVRLLGAGKNATKDEALAPLDAALGAIHGQPKHEPAVIPAIIEEAQAAFATTRPDFAGTVETYIDADLPAVIVSRRHMISFLRHALWYGAEQLSRGGSITLLASYSVGERAMEVSVVATGTACRRNPESCYEAALRWAVRDGHEGQCAIEEKPNELAITATLPDTVGRKLDAEFPGWEQFTLPSQQMLRLLRSGGPTPPAEVILPGVLETELEAWLWPRLTEPAVINRAHELDLKGATCPGGSIERRAKALGQIRRRKPKKEIVKPPYASEVIWAFGVDAAHQTILGTDRLDADGLRRLCIALAQSPPDAATALRLVAVARSNLNS